MFSGSLVAMVTPMRLDGSVDLETWRSLIDWHLDSGTSGLVVGGTTGESATLTESELALLTEQACARVSGKIPVIVGAGTSSTATTVERVRRLCELPIDGLLIVTPAYNRPTQEGLYEHFAAAARAARVPLILYNVPSRTAVDMLPDTVARLSQLPGIRGVKEAVTAPERMRELVAQTSRDFAILSGDDGTARRSILEGARGVISVTANVVPRAMAGMVAAASRRETDEAERIDQGLAALHRELFVEANPIPVKWVLTQMKRTGGGIRLPLTTLSAVHQPAVLAAVRAAGIEV